jgi:DNA-directed RNA polymerase subunit M/transcription elongation factor TFIIS
MSFIYQNSELYYTAKKERAGYICAECGNVTSFREYYDEYTILYQDEHTGELVDSSNSPNRGTREVLCEVCGSNNVSLCEKGLRYKDGEDMVNGH